MSGHSKWANIKHRKEDNDKRRGILFTKLSKELMAAARLGGPDASSNTRLRLTIAKARSCNMPRDTIERAIKKGSGDLDGFTYEEIIYEIFAVGGVGILVESLTDKKSRTTPEIKSILTKYNANLAETNAVHRLFERRGVLTLSSEDVSEARLFETAVEAGADDIIHEDDLFIVSTSEKNYAQVLDALLKNELTMIESALRLLPIEGCKTKIGVPESRQKILNLIDALEGHDDVQAVYSNMT